MLFTETPAADLDKAWVVSPGIEGFIMFMVLALAGWFLIASMLRHIRRANFRAEEREAELYGPADGGSGAPGGDDVSVTPGGDAVTEVIELAEGDDAEPGKSGTGPSEKKDADRTKPKKKSGKKSGKGKKAGNKKSGKKKG